MFVREKEGLWSENFLGPLWMTRGRQTRLPGAKWAPSHVDQSKLEGIYLIGDLYQNYLV